MTDSVLSIFCYAICLLPIALIALGACLLLGAWADGSDGVEP